MVQQDGGWDGRAGRGTRAAFVTAAASASDPSVVGSGTHLRTGIPSRMESVSEWGSELEGGAAPSRMRRTAGGARPQSEVPEAWWGGQSSAGGTATGEVTWWGDPVGRKPRWGAVCQEARRNLEGWQRRWTAAGEAEHRGRELQTQEQRQDPAGLLNGGFWSGLGVLSMSRCVWNCLCMCVPASSVHGRQHPLQTSLPSSVLPLGEPALLGVQGREGPWSGCSLSSS